MKTATSLCYPIPLPQPSLLSFRREELSSKISLAMQLIWQNVIPDGPGTVELKPVEDDDMWHAYNLICPGDTVQATTVRKVVRDMGSGGRDAERVRMMLEIRVEAVDYYKEGSVLRVRGKNFTQNEHVKIGQFHTLELELHRPFVISKKIWDSIARDILHEACDHAASVDLSVILMQEGLAQLFMVGRSVTTARSRIETPIPRNSRKHGPAISGYESYENQQRFRWKELKYRLALKKFFENVLQALLMHIDFSIVRCVVIASPGFTKDQFRDYLFKEAQRQDLKTIIKNKSRIILAHATSGYTHSLKDVLESPNVMNLIKDTKAAKEVGALKDFFTMLSNDSSRACYGPRHVKFANDRMAVSTLLITENLFRNADIAERQRYVHLVESVKDLGGTVHIFSSMHVSGEQLAQLTGVAALLRFPLPELEDLEMYVEFANDRMAVETLLITENLFRNADVGERQRYVRLVESVKDSGGTVHIFSSLHISGEQLEQLTGITALLRFPLLELDGLEM